ncbi:hypothetical protein BDFB_012543 [Asbolus verrucosus]|uniref:Uncharacterized protein n=1 Tax=Asbolus verrucosus TaxID=1661398 RepID=A0A482W8L7_ASBVE|nr:hypothetical protein BDFB_012543 [Asbolus verrucosus]
MIGLTLDLPDDKCANLFLQLLADSGCFNMWPALKTKEEVETEDIEKIDEESAGMAKTDVTLSILVVPNSEIKRYLTAQCDVADSVQSEYQVQADRVKRYIGALMSVLQQQNKSAFDTLATAVAEMFSDQASMPENEYDLHSILFTFAYVYIDLNTCCKIGIVKGRKKNVRGELASNIIITRLDTGLILEIKYDHSSSKEALCQIFDKKYDTIFNDHRAFKNKIYVGLHMSKSDEVTISYIVDSTEGKLKGTASSVDKDNKCA